MSDTFYRQTEWPDFAKTLIFKIKAMEQYVNLISDIKLYAYCFCLSRAR